MVFGDGPAMLELELFEPIDAFERHWVNVVGLDAARAIKMGWLQLVWAEGVFSRWRVGVGLGLNGR